MAPVGTRDVAPPLGHVTSALHIIGQSYGGWLLLEYMSGQPKGIASIVLASTSSSLPEFSAETAVLIAQLPKQHQQAIKVHGNKGDYQHTDYQAAVEAFNHAFLCRIDPWPDCIMRTGANIAASKSSPVMNGPNDFTVIGNLKDWDRSVETRDIKLPTLITCGEFDAVSPACAVTLKKAIPHAELRLFKGCSHVPHLEDEVNYMNIIEQFLQAHDV